LEEAADDARDTMEDLSRVGISMKAVTDRLAEDGSCSLSRSTLGWPPSISALRKERRRPAGMAMSGKLQDRSDGFPATGGHRDRPYP